MAKDLELNECLEILKANRRISKERRFVLDDDVLDMCISMVQKEINWRNSDTYKRGMQ